MKKLGLKVLFSVFLLSFLFMGNGYAQSSEQKVKDIASAILAHQTPKWGPDSVKTLEAIAISEGDCRNDNCMSSIGYFRYILTNAPAARRTTMYNGITIYKALIEGTSDAALKQGYEDTLLAIYELRLALGEDQADLHVRRAFEWYSYKQGKEDFPTVLGYFEDAIALAKDATSPAFMVPYNYLTVKANKLGTYTTDQVLENYEKIAEVCENNISAGKDGGNYRAALEAVEKDLNDKGYFDCTKIIPIAQKKYNANPDDIDNLKKVYNQLKSSKCYDDPLFLAVAKKLNAAEPNAARCKFLARYATGSEAMDYLKCAADLAEDNGSKADAYYDIANQYYKNGDFSSARTYYYKAAEFKPGWGDPYLQIGKLYASSGPKCGPGTGFESQVVTWAAIDMFQKAKNIDPSVAGEAQSLINKYSAYMPSKEDCFFKGLKDGDSYSIGCWMGVTTTVRAR